MEIPRHWRLKVQRYRLEGSTCLTCGLISFPPRPVCPHCVAQLMEITEPGLVRGMQQPFTKQQAHWGILKNEKSGLSALK